MSHEIAWATEPTFEESPDGRVIRCDYNEIGIPGEDGTHDKVVRICEVALALSPRSDIAASAARAPNGEVVGFGGLPLAEKQIPRANLPAAALPEWNRRWRDAIAIRVAAPTYPGAAFGPLAQQRGAGDDVRDQRGESRGRAGRGAEATHRGRS
ncbi:hypothetical protein NYR55_01940 [Sphingomonas sp. BGYR3]|uniref:hypothetical protein n=1 Tax=Sphingomonas sp. BGYR3 TaxID=2975483 RepID=UPI0021A25DD1|nr:hypothetical protein [Sphingomonas sp. BGYR3]MDG5487388.1 hypothetical protein [Sphingomonas sp. BGYR3]